MTPDPLRETVLTYLAEQLRHEDTAEQAVLLAKAEAILAALGTSPPTDIMPITSTSL